ncbi:MAG TPA: ferritin family protein [Halanaerobiales bacterium]|nr:ferritin family protein [Halanaerobiales bacterium]
MQKENFNPMEIIEMAKQIEMNGIDFYEKHVNSAEEKELRKLFSRLKEEEKEHYRKFQDIEKDFIEDISKESYEYLKQPEVIGYLRILVEYSIFPPAVSRKGVLKLKAADEILLIAIMAEKESILFYRELLEVNEGKTARMIEQLIVEEKKHLLDLSEISKKYS